MSLSVLGSLVLASLVAFCVGELEATETPNERHGVYLPRATTSIPSTLSSSSQAHITSNPLATQSGCIYFTSVVSSCEMAMTSFEHRPASEQASCLCYIGTKYAPASLDDAISDCASAAYKSAYQYYTVFSLLEDFCLNNGSTGEGNRTQPTTSSGTTSYSTPYSPTSTQYVATPTTTPKGINGIQDMSLAGIGGLTAGCSIAGVLVLLGIYVACYRRVHPASEDLDDEINGNAVQQGDVEASEKATTAAPEVRELRFVLQHGITA